MRSKEGVRLAGSCCRRVEKRRRGLWGKKKVKVSLERVAEGVVVEVKGVVWEECKGVLGEARSLVRSVQKECTHKVLVPEGTYWEEERVRVGTGYRVKGLEELKEKGLRRRELDLGYGHRRTYDRPYEMGVEVSKAGRKLSREGESARQKVIKEVCGLERRRPLSEYTGCGRTRKSRVGKKKLKPTKVRV